MTLNKHPTVGLTFPEVVNACFNQTEFVQQWERLSGFKLGGTGIVGAIDVATGYQDAALMEFVKFVKETVWDRLG